MQDKYNLSLKIYKNVLSIFLRVGQVHYSYSINVDEADPELLFSELCRCGIGEIRRIMASRHIKHPTIAEISVLNAVC